jgi:hypothetical protein
MKVVKEYKAIIDPLLVKDFSDYDGEMLVECPNIVKLYPSGREGCLFAIFAFAVKNLLYSACPKAANTIVPLQFDVHQVEGLTCYRDSYTK